MRANFVPALLLAVVSFVGFRQLYLRWCSMVGRAVLVGAAFALATPGVLFASNYLLMLPYASWFIELHSLPGAEISSGLVGSWLGVMFASSRLRPSKLNGPILIVCAVMTVGLVCGPFLKQLYGHVYYETMDERWRDGVCLQSSSYTCMPASVTTIVKMMGGHITEPELAREAGSTVGGTEFWYLRRALRKHGFDCRFRWVGSARRAPVPCVLGVMNGDLPHAVVLLHKDAKGVVIGEPLRGRREYDWALFKECYRPEGSAIVIVRTSRSAR